MNPISEVFSSHFWTLLVTGLSLHLIGSFWLLFVAYRTDIELGRLLHLVPAVGALVVARNPKAAIFPFLLQTAGFLMLCAAINSAWSAVFSASQGVFQ
jgi:hypothetical protein